MNDEIKDAADLKKRLTWISKASDKEIRNIIFSKSEDSYNRKAIESFRRSIKGSARASDEKILRDMASKVVNNKRQFNLLVKRLEEHKNSNI